MTSSRRQGCLVHLLLLVVFIEEFCAEAKIGEARALFSRHPEYILHPTIKCTSEGFFVHPRNCSYFYRCRAAKFPGYFQRYFFECPPGTVFSNEVQTCIPRTEETCPVGEFPSQANEVPKRVDCPHVGFFANPVDGRKFYRCFDRLGHGYYWKAFFECSKGTMFSETLQQCVPL